tara:strand:- start:543 stop:680 length:138 start_codon:yes stop_codon:yes gene_type:complete
MIIFTIIGILFTIIFLVALVFGVICIAGFFDGMTYDIDTETQEKP